MRRLDVAIVGAGVAGLLTALHLTRNRKAGNIAVFERRPPRYIPRKHCAGIVSRNTLERLPFASKFVEQYYSSVKIYVLSGLELELVFDRRAILKIDRVGHERYLIERLSGAGIDMKFGTAVNSLEKSPRGYRVRTSMATSLEYDAVVVAEGYPPRLSRKLGFKARLEPFRGLQQDVVLGNRLRYEGSESLYVLLGFSDGGFAWFVPVSEKSAVVGIATRGRAPTELEHVKKFFEKMLALEIIGRGDIYGGTVLRGCPLEPCSKGALGIGDSVGMVKSLSGGGLYPISIVSEIYGNNIHRPDRVKKLVKQIVRELRTQYNIYRISRLFLGMGLGRLLPLKRAVVEIGNSYFYDHHEKILAKLFTGVGSVARRRPGYYQVGSCLGK